jgi:hypothetical protein
MVFDDVQHVTSTQSVSLSPGYSLPVEDPKPLQAQQTIDRWLGKLDMKTLAAMVMVMPENNPLVRMVRWKIRSIDAQPNDGGGATGKGP